MSEIVSLHSVQNEDENNNFVGRLCNRCFSGEKEEKVDPYDVDVDHKNQSRYKTNSWTQFRWIVWRNFIDIFKNPFEIRLRIILALVSWFEWTLISYFLFIEIVCDARLVYRYYDWSSLYSFELRSDGCPKYQRPGVFDYHQYVLFEYFRHHTGKKPVTFLFLHRL